MCRNYCNVTLDKALTVVGVPIDFVWRLPENVYYYPKICEVPADSSLPAPTPKSSKQPLAIPDAFPLPEISKGSSQVGDQGQKVEGEKGKGKDKGKKPSAKAKDAAKAKEVEAETQEAEPKAKDAATTQPSQKEDPPTEA